LSGEWISAILGWRKELPLAGLAEEEVERSRKNMILKLVSAAKQFLLSELIPQVEKTPPLVVRCSVGGIVVGRSFVAMPC
jgi:hypothetical protein